MAKSYLLQQDARMRRYSSLIIIKPSGLYNEVEVWQAEENKFHFLYVMGNQPRTKIWKFETKTDFLLFLFSYGPNLLSKYAFSFK